MNPSQIEVLIYVVVSSTVDLLWYWNSWCKLAKWYNNLAGLEINTWINVVHWCFFKCGNWIAAMTTNNNVHVANINYHLIIHIGLQKLDLFTWYTIMRDSLLMDFCQYVMQILNIIPDLWISESIQVPSLDLAWQINSLIFYDFVICREC